MLRIPPRRRTLVPPKKSTKVRLQVYSLNPILINSSDIAKDSHVPLSDRARAAMNAVGDKMDQHQHSVRLRCNKMISAPS